MVKKGKLTNSEKIKVNELSKDGLTIEEIAKHLDRSETVIEPYVETFSKLGTREEVIITELKRKSWWKQVVRQFNKEEQSFFIERYVELVMQFGGDLLATEEDQVQRYLTYQLMGHRILASRKRIAEEQDELIEGGNLEEARDLQRDIERHDKQYTENSKQAESILTGLKARREQRITNVASSAENWVVLMRNLQNEKEKENVGREVDAHRLAKDMALHQYRQPHEFADGKVDSPILINQDPLITKKELNDGE